MPFHLTQGQIQSLHNGQRSCHSLPPYYLSDISDSSHLPTLLLLLWPCWFLNMPIATFHPDLCSGCSPCPVVPPETHMACSLTPQTFASSGSCSVKFCSHSLKIALHPLTLPALSLLYFVLRHLLLFNIYLFMYWLVVWLPPLECKLHEDRNFHWYSSRT